MIDESSQLWRYLSVGQQSLIRQGYYLLEDLQKHVPVYPITDYSFIVFPFAKAYEGFLKQLFLDMKLIKRWQYESEQLRIGKILSPNLVKMLKKRSVYYLLTQVLGNSELADQFWLTWKRGRNAIFHYYPHNLSAISLSEAEAIVTMIITAMNAGASAHSQLNRVYSASTVPVFKYVRR